MKPKVSIYLKNKIDSPSAYYSITQYTRRMDDFEGHVYGLWPNTLFRLFMRPVFRHGVGNILRKGILFFLQSVNMLRFMLQDIYGYKPDSIIICREAFPQKMLGCFSPLYRKLLNSRNVIWTFDDNIKMGEISQREWKMLCRYSDEIMVTHEYLKDTLPEMCRERVSFIPQADGDISREIVESTKQSKRVLYEKEIHLVWVATAANLPNMYNIQDVLEEAAKKLQEQFGKQLVLNVVCNEKYTQEHQYLKVNNIRWTRIGAAKKMAESHIGIMPLMDNEYNKGKGGFKLVQYMTADIPVIASNVGYNSHVVGGKAGILIRDQEEKSGWIDAIIKLSTDMELWDTMSSEANARCAEAFSFEKNLDLWKRKLGYTDSED